MRRWSLEFQTKVWEARDRGGPVRQFCRGARITTQDLGSGTARTANREADFPSSQASGVRQQCLTGSRGIVLPD
jgi:hypothetical protein